MFLVFFFFWLNKLFVCICVTFLDIMSDHNKLSVYI